MASPPDIAVIEGVAAPGDTGFPGARAAAQPRPKTGESGREPGTAAQVIRIRERSLQMLIKDLLLRNPLRVVDLEDGQGMPAGAMGAVMARAGVGKTAFVVQLALNEMLRENSVLHISLEDPVNKVKIWYEEVFHLLADQYDVKQVHHLWDLLQPHRFIMTFRVEGFSVPKLEERLTDLTDQGIFRPRMILIDGLPFDGPTRGILTDLKALAVAHSCRMWFTMRIHRHEEPGPGGLPRQLEPVSDLFAAALQLLPEGDNIHVRALIGGEPGHVDTGLHLDPSTMLVRKAGESTR